MDKNSLQLADEWFKKAQADLDFARIGLKETNHYGQVCFFCQQVVEKYLKGFLVAHQRKFRKIHHTSSLIKRCINIDQRFEKFTEKCKILDSYYIPTRYPVPWEEKYTKKDAENSLKIAESIVKLVRDGLKLK